MFEWRAMSEEVELFCSAPYAVDIIHFPGIPLYLNIDLLQSKFKDLGHSLKRIAQDFGCSEETVRKYLRKMGLYSQKVENYVPTPPKNIRYGERLVKGNVVAHTGERRVVKLIMEKHAQGWTLRQISAYLEGLGIPTKTGKKKWAIHTLSRTIIYYKKKSDFKS